MSGIDSPEKKHPWNCVSCRRRKLRCDRGKPPCDNCVKARRECVYPTAGRAFQRPEQPVHARAKAPRADSGLLDRLRRLEAAVDGLSSELESARSSRHVWPEKSRPANSPGDADFGASYRCADASGASPVASGGARVPAIMAASGFGARGGVYVGDNFWAMLRREITVVRETFAELEGDEAEVDAGYAPSFVPSHRATASDPSAFFFGGDPRARFEGALERLRPSPPHMLFIWQTFLHNVSPIIHLVHNPSFQKVLQDSRYRCDELGADMETLAFAISTITINTLTAEEVEINFSRDKKQLLAEFRFGTEQALARADFINTSSISVVQALTLYLACVRWNNSARHAWTLVGLLVRIAVSIGLHRDGSHFPNISPFEVENRRRLWWHVCCFDERLSEGQVHGFGISKTGFDTLPPTNVNDDDLDPAMTVPPTARAGNTETSFTLLRYEAWHFMHDMRSIGSEIASGHLDADSGVQCMLKTLQGFKASATERFGTHPDESLNLALTTVFGLNFKLWELIIKHQRPPLAQDSLPDAEAFSLALSVLEDIASVRHEPTMRRVSWFLNGNVHWQPCAIILSRICSIPWDSTAEHAWDLVTDSLAGVPQTVQADPVWQPLKILLNKTHRHRAHQLELQCRGSRGAQSEAPPRLVGPSGLHLTQPITPGITPVTPAEGEAREKRPTTSARPADVRGVTPDPMSGITDESFSGIPAGDTANIGIEDLDLAAWNEFLWSGGPVY